MNGDTPFWCHSCRTQVFPQEGSFACPLCAGEFIEELTEDQAQQQQEAEPPFPAEPFPQMNAGPANFANLFTLLQQLMPQPQAANPQHNMYYTNNGNNFVFHANIPTMPNAGVPFANNPFVGLLQQFLGGQNFGGNVFGDYVVGDNLEPLLNQLFQQHQSRGAPPASPDAVSTLPVYNISEEDAKRHDECCVCKVNFEAGEQVKELPCVHVFHPECVDRWLQQRNFCPMCRYELSTDDADYEARRAQQQQQQQQQQQNNSNSTASPPPPGQPEGDGASSGGNSAPSS